MREIDNKINNTNFMGIQKAQEAAPVAPEEVATPVESKEIKDLSGMPSASIGRSQITSDSLETDMQILAKNPAQVEQLNQIFEKFQENHTYEEATQLMDAYRQEFMVKK